MEIPFDQQEAFAREYLLRDRYVDIDLMQCAAHDSDLPYLSVGVRQFFNRSNLVRAALSIQAAYAADHTITARLMELVLRFTPDVRNELFTLCTDVENGGLGIFIYLLENTLPFVRPEWEEICIALKEHQPFDTSQMTIGVIDHDMLRQSSRFQMKK